MYIQHRLDNTIGKIVFRHVPKFVDSNSLLALFPLPPLHSPLYNESKTHGGDSLNQFFSLFFFYENSARRVYINYRMCVYVRWLRDARVSGTVCVCLSFLLCELCIIYGTVPVMLCLSSQIFVFRSRYFDRIRCKESRRK